MIDSVAVRASQEFLERRFGLERADVGIELHLLFVFLGLVFAIPLFVGIFVFVFVGVVGRRPGALATAALLAPAIRATVPLLFFVEFVGFFGPKRRQITHTTTAFGLSVEITFNH